MVEPVHPEPPRGAGSAAPTGASAEQRFRAAFVGNTDPRVETVALLPSRLAQAAASVLPVDGVGLSVFSVDFRVPLGASDAAAGEAERLQFTHGQGPCLQAHHGSAPIRADAAQVEAEWPLLYSDLIRLTPYRSVVALPLRRISSGRGGAIDLYFNDPSRARTLDLDDALSVASMIVDILLLAGVEESPIGLTGPAWLYGPEARKRMQVWIAIGMVNVALQRHDDDVLALLRAYAYANDRTLDSVAQSVLDHELLAEQLQP